MVSDRNIPTEQEIERLHKKYAPNETMFHEVYDHCRTVWEIAKQLMETHHITVDIDMVKAGCLLHDIGVYKLWNPATKEMNWKEYISHAVLGEALLRDESVSDTLCNIVLNHAAVGISRDDVIARQLSIPAHDYFPETVEGRLVMYADKFHSKSAPTSFYSIAGYKNYIKKFGDDKVKRFDGLVREFGEPNLEYLAKKYRFTIR